MSPNCSRETASDSTATPCVCPCMCSCLCTGIHSHPTQIPHKSHTHPAHIPHTSSTHPAHQPAHIQHASGMPPRFNGFTLGHVPVCAGTARCRGEGQHPQSCSMPGHGPLIVQLGYEHGHRAEHGSSNSNHGLGAQSLPSQRGFSGEWEWSWQRAGAVPLALAASAAAGLLS